MAMTQTMNYSKQVHVEIHTALTELFIAIQRLLNNTNNCLSAINPFFYTFLGTNFHRRWKMAVGKAGKNIRQSILSHSADYTPGDKIRYISYCMITNFPLKFNILNPVIFLFRRQSSAADGKKHRDDLSSSSFTTKHTIIPTNNMIIKEERV